MDYSVKGLMPSKRPASLSIMIKWMTEGDMKPVISEFPRQKLCDVATRALWPVLNRDEQI